MHRLRHEGAAVSVETLEHLMLDNHTETTNKSIVAILAGHERALAMVNRNVTTVCKVSAGTFPSAPQTPVVRNAYKRTNPGKPPSVVKAWNYPRAPRGTCRHCGKRGHEIRDCTVKIVPSDFLHGQDSAYKRSRSGPVVQNNKFRKQ